MNVLSVVGVRPEFVMAMPVSRTLAAGHRETLVHTGQHYDELLSDVFFEELALPEPAHELGVGSAPRHRQVGRIASRLAPILSAEDPDVVLVYGDTNSTLGGAVAAAEHGATLAHVEAGVRSFDPPMPEERNRVLTDRRADLLLAPTDDAVRNLVREGVDGTIRLTGDVRGDAFDLVSATETTGCGVLDRLDVRPDEFALATVHRASNTDDAGTLRSLLHGLGSSRPPVVLPLHPRTEARLRESGLYSWAADRVRLVEPVGYPDFVRLLDAAACVATDSGGVQREATLAGTPCVTLRETTEWPGAVRAGYNRLVGTDALTVRRAVDRAADDRIHPDRVGGDVATRIVDALVAATDERSWRAGSESGNGRIQS